MDVEDEKAYKKSVRNMSVVLAAIVITVFAALGYGFLNPVHDHFQTTVSQATGQDFTLHLQISSTNTTAHGSIAVAAWIISTSPSINNVTAENLWNLPTSSLWTAQCVNGWPVGIGVMQGHYDSSNYSLGTLVRPIVLPLACPFNVAPGWFAFESGTSNSIVSISGNLEHWNVTSGVLFSHASAYDFAGPGELTPGTYTVLAADEWGDVLATNFIVTA